MTKELSRLFPVLSFILFLLPLASPLQAQDDLHAVWAVKDCRIVTQPGSVVEKGTVVIRDGLIEAAGPSISVPQDAEVIDGSSLTVYPGLIDSLGRSLLNLPQKKFDPSKVYTGQFTDKDKGIVPERKAYQYFQISKSTLQKYHKCGITAAQVIPETGILTGQSSFFSLAGSDKNVNLILKDCCLGIGFSPASFMVYPSSLMGVVAFIRQEFIDAFYFAMHTSRWQNEMTGLPRPEFDPRLSILSDYAGGKKPVIFFCRNQNDIRRALELAQELDLDYFLCDMGNEAFRVIPELKKANARVFCPVSFKMPATSIHAQLGKEEGERAEKEIYVKNPARLAEAGIPFAFSSLGTDDPESFIEGVRKAVKNGLSRQKALQALTINGARFLGLEKAMGTVEPGKIANLVLVEGKILSEDAKIKHVFVDGQKFEIKEVKVKEGEKPTVNVSGRWEISIPSQGLKVTADFVQEQAALSGKMTTPFGVFDLSAGSVSGNEIYFEMNIAVGGQEIDLYFSAVVEGDRMEGTVVQGTEGSAEFTGRRIPS
ncbi:MAG: amidohydrolase family protein [Candidatus Aminicenantes bacterium]